MLGLFDWSHVSEKASAAFKLHMETLEPLLPYHDVDGFSTYDLSHIIFGLGPYIAPPYLGIHVYLLHALASVTNSAVLKQYEMKWAAKIDEMNKPAKDHWHVVRPPVSAAGRHHDHFSAAVSRRQRRAEVVPVRGQAR